MITLTGKALILTVLLTGCVSGRVPTIGPKLPDPPPSVVDALEKVARADASAAAWVIRLDQFYRKQDIATQ
jgi:hypothetical protein